MALQYLKLGRIISNPIFTHSITGRRIVSVNENVLKSTTKITVRQDCEFGIATTLRDERSGVRTPVGARGFLFSIPVHTSTGADPASSTMRKGLYVGDKEPIWDQNTE